MTETDYFSMGITFLFLVAIAAYHFRRYLPKKGIVPVLENIPIEKSKIIDLNMDCQYMLIHLLRLERFSNMNYVFDAKGSLGFALSKALAYRSIPYFQGKSRASLNLIRAYDLSAFSTLVEFFVTRNAVPSLEVWRMDYGYNERSFILKVDGVEIAMDKLMVELLESLDYINGKLTESRNA